MSAAEMVENARALFRRQPTAKAREAIRRAEDELAAENQLAENNATKVESARRRVLEAERERLLLAIRPEDRLERQAELVGRVAALVREWSATAAWMKAEQRTAITNASRLSEIESELGVAGSGAGRSAQPLAGYFIEAVKQAVPREFWPLVGAWRDGV